MSLKPTMMFYPVESYNTRRRAEQRWDDEACREGNPYCQTEEWQISIKNGKRLRRHWTRNGGFTIVSTRHGDKSIYNQRYDVELNRAMEQQYDRSFQPDDDPDFYSYPIQRSYANY